MSDSSPQPAPGSPPAESEELGPLEPTPISPVYAGFWRRAVALVIDVLLVGVPLTAILFAFFPEQLMLEAVEPPPLTVQFLLYQAFTIVVWLVYVAGFESSRYQATVGKHIMGILVTDRKFQRAGFGQCVKRGWIYWLPGAVSLIDALMHIMVLQLIAFVVVLVSCVMVAFTARKQALHDIIAHCYLIRRNEARD